jgi:hypothetical protein
VLNLMSASLYNPERDCCGPWTACPPKPLAKEGRPWTFLSPRHLSAAQVTPINSFSHKVGVHATFIVIKQSWYYKMTSMNKFSLLLVFCLCLTLGLQAQEEIKKDLKPFNSIIASPRINLILRKGDHESIRLVYHDVSQGKINIEVHHKTLQIYLDNARKVEKMASYTDHYRSRKSMYAGVSITAYVTYKNLESLEIRGNQELTCQDALESDEFRLKAYGENEITLASLKTDYFKASLYGQNVLKIRKGRVVEQKYKLYGENRIDTRDMRSAFASASIFGEGNIRINTSEEVRVDAFGEPSIYVNGGAHVNRRLIFGRTEIHQD